MRMIVNKPVDLVVDGHSIPCQVTGTRVVVQDSKVITSITVSGIFTDEELALLIGTEGWSDNGLILHKIL